MDYRDVAGVIILGFLLPLWLVFGFADWVCHRRSVIAKTSGWRESALHLLLVAEAACAALPLLFFEINALILGISLVAYLAHELTTNVDVGFADPRRMINATEQRVHDYLTAIPFGILLMLAVTYSGQFAALFGFGNEAADFSLRWKTEPLPLWYLIGWLVLSPINAVLYLEEFIRCLRARRAQHA
jgi:hypothetical protein